MEKEKKSVFDILNDVDVNGHTEEKNGLTYLSWAWAWGELKKHYPEATYEIERFGEEKKPYLYDEQLGYMVFTSMTIEGQTHEMWLPVMDGANKAMKNKPYTYKVFKYVNGKKVWNDQLKQYEMVDKAVETPTMFDINKTIMRCLVKNISMFGLGLYIYAGEDLPESKVYERATKEQLKIIIQAYTGENLNKLLEVNQISKIDDLPKDKADELIKKIIELKNKKGKE